MAKRDGEAHRQQKYDGKSSTPFKLKSVTEFEHTRTYIIGKFVLSAKSHREEHDHVSGITVRISWDAELQMGLVYVVAFDTIGIERTNQWASFLPPPEIFSSAVVRERLAELGYKP